MWGLPVGGQIWVRKIKVSKIKMFSRSLELIKLLFQEQKYFFLLQNMNEF